MSTPLRTEDARTASGASLTGSYANVGTALANSARIIFIFNGCDEPITVSWDGGATDGFVLPATSAVSVDCSINKEGNQHPPQLPVGAQFQAKHNGVVPTSGSVSITVIY